MLEKELSRTHNDPSVPKFVGNVIIMILMITGFIALFNELGKEFEHGKARLIVWIVFFVFPFSLLIAFRNAHDLYAQEALVKANDDPEKKLLLQAKLQRDRNAMRFWGEMLGSVTLFGACFALANTYASWGEKDHSHKYYALVESYNKLLPQLTAGPCRSDQTRNANQCKEFSENLNKLGLAALGSEDKKEISEAIKKLTLSLSSLRLSSPDETRSAIDAFNSDAMSMQPTPELQGIGISLAAYSFVLMLAAAATALKLGGAIFDSRKHVPFSAASARVLRR